MRTERRHRGRRAFLKSTASLSTLALGAAHGAPEAAAAQRAQQPASTAGTARALLEVVRARYGQHLDATAEEDLLRRIEANVRGDQQLANYPLTNTDAPDFVFRTD